MVEGVTDAVRTPPHEPVGRLRSSDRKKIR